MQEITLLGTATLTETGEVPVPIACIDAGAIDLHEYTFWAEHQLIDAVVVSPRYDQFRETFATMVIGATRTATPRHVRLPDSLLKERPSPVKASIEFAPGETVCFVEHAGLRKNDWWLVTTMSSDWLPPRNGQPHGRTPNRESAPRSS